MATAVAPYVPFYASHVPYLTVDEFLAEPTGVDVSQLVPGGAAHDNEAALKRLIVRASNYADSLCYQVLAATLDLQVGVYRMQKDGTIRVPFDFSPVIEVRSVNFGYSSGSLAALTDLSGVWFQSSKVAWIPVAGTAAPTSSIGSGAPSGSVFAQVQYVNGYACTTLAADAAVSASTITLASAVGIFPGMPLTISSGAGTELVSVAPSYVQGSSTVPLLTPLQYAHTAGTMISAMPGAIKQAVIALTTHLIKARGAEALMLDSVSGGPAAIDHAEPGATEEYDQAIDLLHPFRRVR